MGVKGRRKCIRSYHTSQILFLAVISRVPSVMLVVDQVDPKKNVSISVFHNDKCSTKAHMGKMSKSNSAQNHAWEIMVYARNLSCEKAEFLYAAP